MALQKEYISTFGMVHPEAYYKIIDIRFANRATYREMLSNIYSIIRKLCEYQRLF
jgi:hypothetical protein